MVRTKQHKQVTLRKKIYEYLLKKKKKKKVIRLRCQILVILDMHPCKEMKIKNSLGLV